jgi:hypothetical protein
MLDFPVIILTNWTTHEPSLYQAIKQDTYVLFLWQLDNFAITVEHDGISEGLINNIDKYMKVQLEPLRCAQILNKMDVQQTNTSSKYPAKLTSIKY